MWHAIEDDPTHDVFWNEMGAGNLFFSVLFFTCSASVGIVATSPMDV